MSQRTFQPPMTGPAPKPKSPAICSWLTSRRQPRKASSMDILCTNCHMAPCSISLSGKTPVRGVSRSTTLKVASMATRPCISSASRYQSILSNVMPKLSHTSDKYALKSLSLKGESPNGSKPTSPGSSVLCGLFVSPLGTAIQGKAMELEAWTAGVALASFAEAACRLGKACLATAATFAATRWQVGRRLLAAATRTAAAPAERPLLARVRKTPHCGEEATARARSLCVSCSPRGAWGKEEITKAEQPTSSETTTAIRAMGAAPACRPMLFRTMV
mmetsp:Transcript_81412/g.174268  ORF Transcript_81412/g.174268 Transcript_81412/m.174268 type:complete len:275 (+) Transcript_81412:1383-2207(+)